MPVINGVYLKDFTALPSSVTDANIIPIAITGDQVAYRTTVAGIVTDARITSKLLTGLSVTGATILSTDTILQAFGKVQNQLNGKVTSVGLTMPSAFSVANSPITSAGTLAVTAAGVASQYIRGDGALADFPTNGGGGSSVSYYLNGSVSQGTFVGNTYYEMNKTPVIGTGTDFTIGANGYIAQFITDANDPASLLIPAGNWNVEMYFSASSNGGSPSFYVEVYKYNGTTFTLLGTSSATPEGITNGTAIDIYYTSVGIPETVLTITDRLAIRIYVTHSGRTITLHTEDNHLSEIITTFSNGINTLNGLTKQAQYFAVGSSGTDFAIVSSVDTHTFNLPTASASNRGALSSADWTTFNNKAAALSGTINTIAYWDSSTTIASLALATYPSLTELSYVKGVTSAIQTQLNAKQATITLTTTGTSGAATFIANTLNIPNYADGGVLSLSAIGATANANGATITGTVLNLQPADASFGGVVTTGTQTFAGTKTLTGDLFISKSAPSIQLKAANGSVAGFILANSAGTHHWTLETDVSAAGAQGEFRLKNPILNTNAINISTANLVTLTGGLVGTTANFTGQLTLGSTITNGTYTYTLPSATGTLALTSALSGYLPLSGGTLTGALSGTSATFSSTVSATQYTATSTGGSGLRVYGSAGTNQWDIYLNSTNLRFSDNTGTGSVVFDRPLSGTSATFSSTISAGAISTFYSGGAGTAGQIRLGYDATAYWQIGRLDPAGTGSGNFQFKPNAGTSVFDITSSGNVGIGTTSPQGKLDIFNSTNAATTPLISIRSDFATIGNYGMIRFGDFTQTSLYQKGALIYESVSSAARGKFHIALENTDSSTSVALTDAKLTVLSSGNVGIGTTSPSEKLEVNGAIKTAAPSGGTAKPFKVGNVATVTPTLQNRTIEIEIDGTTYYLTAKTTNN